MGFAFNKNRHSFVRRFAVAATISSLLGVLSPTIAYSETPTRIIVPYGAGGGIDQIGRMFGEVLRSTENKNAIVENRPGAGGMIGMRQVAISPPDGKTLGIAGASPLILSKLTKKDLPFNPDDLDMIASLGAFGFIIAVRSDSPYSTFSELLDASKKEGSNLNIGSAQIGTTTQMTLDYLKSEIGLSGLSVPYTGDAEILVGLLGGNVDMGIITLTGALPMLESGKIKALGITSENRSTRYPQIPTLNELGFPGVVSEGWVGIVVPKDTPYETKRQYNDLVNKALVLPEFNNRLKQFGIDFVPKDLETMEAFQKSERTKWSQVAKSAGVTPN